MTEGRGVRGGGWGVVSVFLGPLEVVYPGLDPREVLDAVLQPRPEGVLLHGVIEPAGGDAEVSLVRRHVVYPVVPPRQDDVQVLQEGDPPGQAKVSVRPLVDLIS